MIGPLLAKIRGLRRKILNRLYLAEFNRIEGVEIHPTVLFFGKPTITVVKGGRLVIGRDACLVSRSSDNAVGVSHEVILRVTRAGAELLIGEDSGISGASIAADKSVRIGDRCLIGADVIITDSDFHPVDVVPRRHESCSPDLSRPVSIGNDVFVGARSLILKGVSVGEGSVVGAGAIVTSNIPDQVVAAGNPAAVLRPLRLSK